MSEPAEWQTQGKGSFSVTPGVHTLTMYLREDGTPVDQLIISKGWVSSNMDAEDAIAPADYKVMITKPKADRPEGFSFDIDDAEVGATYQYAIKSDGGGATITGNGTISAMKESVTGVNLTGINKGLVEVSVRLMDTNGNMGMLAKDTMMFLPPDTRWTGSGWSDGAPDASKSIRIETDGQISGDFTCEYLFVDAGAKLHIPAGTTVTVKGDFINNGDGITGGGKIRFAATGDTLEIDESLPIDGVIEIESGTMLRTNNNLILGDGAVLIHQNAEDLEGTVQASRQGNTAPLAYNFWSIPVQEGTEISKIGGSNKYTYDEPSSSWVSNPASVNVGQGLIATGSGEVNMTGTPYVDNVLAPVTYQGTDPTYKGYNLLGNPFLAPLDYDAFVASNPGIVLGNLHFYTGNADGSGSYEVINSGNKMDIPTFQAFFAEVGSDMNIQFLHAHKVANDNSNFVREAEVAFDRLKLEVHSGDYTDKAQLLLGESFTAGNDYGYDASKMFGTQSLALSFVTAGLGDQMMLALPSEETYRLPISIKSAGATEVSIADASIFEGYSVVLVDRATGESWNLGKGVVTLSEVSAESSNYYLEVTAKAQVLSTLPKAGTELSTKFSADGFVLNNLATGTATIQVTDITGKVIFRQEQSSANGSWRGNWTLPSNKVFIMTVTNNDHRSIQKVVFK